MKVFFIVLSSNAPALPPIFVGIACTILAVAILAVYIYANVIEEGRNP